MSNCRSTPLEPLQSVLRRAQWAEKCAPSTLKSFASNGQLRHAKRGELLARVGDPVEHLTFVVDGILQVSQHGEDGRRFIAGYLAAGQLCNLVPFLDRSDAPNDYVAHTDASICLLERSLVEEALKADFGLTQGILALL